MRPATRRKAAVACGIDDRDGKARCLKGLRRQIFQSTGRFDDDLCNIIALQPFEQIGQRIGLVGKAPDLVGRIQSDIDPLHRNIDPNVTRILDNHLQPPDLYASSGSA